MRIYNNGFENRDVLKSYFDITEKDIEAYDILYANYALGMYEGDAFVLLEKEGKLYEVNGSHCSCYGLEGQWEPEETTIEALTSMKERWAESFVLEQVQEALKTRGYINE